MKIDLLDAGKKFYREWIFRHINLTFSAGQRTVIIGPNGSGKSTLLQIIAGSSLLTEGSLNYSAGEKTVEPDSIYKHISLAAPYLELIEEFTLGEIIAFHLKIKPSLKNFKEEELLEATGLAAKRNGIFKFFSSGMKQRVKLTLAILNDTPVLLLDEPCSNLDNTGVEWYKTLISEYSGERIIIVASNDHQEEFFFCNSKILMADLKQ